MPGCFTPRERDPVTHNFGRKNSWEMFTLKTRGRGRIPLRFILRKVGVVGIRSRWY
jgi:hypothetical protein